MPGSRPPALCCRELVFSGHAVRRMFERAITERDVRAVVETGAIVEHYPDDQPFPSVLILGFAGGKPIHVVAGLDLERETCHIVTVYVPNPMKWEPDYRTRRVR